MTILASLAIALGGTAWVQQGADQRPPTPTSKPDEPIPERSQAPDLAPVGITIRAIGVNTSVVRLGLNPDRTVQVPAAPDKAGWYRLGPAPGEPGSAVVLGHVDSATGPAVFYRLASLARGADIEIARADGSVAHFAVSTVTTVANEQFPASEVYSTTGPATLNLITCGGTYDKANGGYQSNVVVTAVLTDGERSTP